jgi:hypothetical protein
VLEEGLALYPANLCAGWTPGSAWRARTTPAAEAFTAVLAGADPAHRDQSVGYGQWLFGPRTRAPLAACMLELGRPAEAERLYAELERQEPEHAEYRVKRRLAAALAGRAARPGAAAGGR